MGTFLFKWPHPEAKDVHVTGTFDDWGKSEQLNQVGDTWEKEVTLPKADEKIYYKFVVDNEWIIDPTAPQEEDGHNNINNVLLPKDIKKHEVPAPVATSAPEKEEEHKTPGSFPETPANETEQAFGVAPIPATSGIGNPISLPAGEKVPEHSAVTDNTVESTATTSKEGYERDASAALPAAAGAVGLGGVAAMIGSAFSKPESKQNLIPESSLPMGGDAKDTMDSGPHISSAAPESSTAALAAGVPMEEKRQAMVIDPADAPPAEADTAPGVPEPVKESLSEAHQTPEAAASADAVKEKSAVEQELLKKTPVSEATGDAGVTAASQTSYYGLATGVPDTVEKSMQQAHAPPEAAADSSVVAEKSAMESELLKKIPSSEAAGEPAPTIAATTSDAAPAATKDTPADSTGFSTAEKVAGGAVGGMGAAGVVAGLASSKDTSEAPKTEPVSDALPVASKEESTLADEPAVKMMQQDEALPKSDAEPGSAVAHDATTTKAPEVTEPTTSAPAASTGAPTTKAPEVAEPTTSVPAASTGAPKTTVPTTTSAKAEKTLGGVIAGAGTTPTGTIASPIAGSTPAKKAAAVDTSSPASSANTKDKKKRNRLSRIYHKIVD